MIIDLASLGVSPKQFEISFAPEEIDIDGEATIKSEIAFNGQVSRVNERTFVRGAIKADAEVDCTRCLEPVDRPIDITFEDVFVEAVAESDKDEVELAVEQLDEALLESEEIDLAEVVREQILLDLPEQIFCKEDCRGLCPQCGGNRNLIDCSCERDQVDPRWAALKELQNLN